MVPPHRSTHKQHRTAIMSTMTLFTVIRSVARPSFRLANPPLMTNIFQNVQNRTFAMTKTKKRRMAKKKVKAANLAKGILPPKPNMFMSKDTPVLNALPRDQRDAEARHADLVASQELQVKMAEKEDEPDALRFKFTGLQMSDRVRKIFDLTNGAQKEIVAAQKKRGMELFQLREGDTGSSAVQGT